MGPHRAQHSHPHLCSRRFLCAGHGGAIADHWQKLRAAPPTLRMRMKKVTSNNGKGDRVELHIIVQSAHMAQSDGEVPDPCVPHSPHRIVSCHATRRSSRLRESLPAAAGYGA